MRVAGSRLFLLDSETGALDRSLQRGGQQLFRYSARRVTARPRCPRSALSAQKRGREGGERITDITLGSSVERLAGLLKDASGR